VECHPSRLVDGTGNEGSHCERRLEGKSFGEGFQDMDYAPGPWFIFCDE